MNVLQYLKKRYPTGKIPATYRVLEEKEGLRRPDVLQLREGAENGYIDVEDLAVMIYTNY